MVVSLTFTGQRSEPGKIKSQIKLEVLDGVLQKQPFTMASNSIFETFPSYQSCFARGESICFLTFTSTAFRPSAVTGLYCFVCKLSGNGGFRSIGSPCRTWALNMQSDIARKMEKCTQKKDISWLLICCVSSVLKSLGWIWKPQAVG